MWLLRRCCLVCGRKGDALCATCTRRLSPPPSTRVRGVGKVPALFAYDGVGATVVQALKFRDGRRLVTPLADAIAERVEADPDLRCTWLPTSAARRRARGFDQSELLARAVGRRLGCPTIALLLRGPGGAQTGRSRDERADNVVFRPHPRIRSLDGPVLVIDDVCTTGATIRAASRALGGTRSGQVRFFTVARTP